MKLKLVIGAAAFALAGLGGAANAATTCTSGDVDFTLSQDGHLLDWFACETGNDEGNGGIGQLAGLTLGDSIGGGPGDGNLDLTVNTGPNTWSLDNPNGYSVLAIAIKQSTEVAVWLLDLSKDLSGTWTVSGPSDSISVYSHFNAWYDDPTDPPVDVIPLPAAGWMLMAGLGGLAAMRRRKKS